MLPQEILTNSIESLIKQHSKGSNTLYITVILFIITALFSLPFISISVTIHSHALIRPSTEVTSIRSLANGTLKESFVKENQLVRSGDILYKIENNVLNEKEKFLEKKKEETLNFSKDLSILIHHSASNTTLPSLKTSFYQQAFSNYEKKLNEVLTHYSKVKRDYDRNLKLHGENVIADAEFENYAYELNKATHELELLKQTQLTQWQSELRNYEKELAQYESELSQLHEEKQNLIIRAPVSGTIQNHASLYAGSMVFSNQDLVQISPDTSLIVEAYVSPNDIGLLQKYMYARYQIDAFNYNQWGLATGKITEISNDIQLINEKPVFKVKCSLDTEYLALKNGYKGSLKKGMTLQARFIVTERTLWQLLYDQMDDWMNPNLYKIQ
ncbi:HlyD family secretion protein [Chryseosolibacter indicus]|uniref:HlyD family efflux transporter periplasmic adaptor subunit n=1 Tax=Chryseosolibacter indicus TaxID=2782351 RepID=A0ABS5VVQ8_9BACT|nr:HlyD family efflux transporter periplasmic adaptor subunit [Chryseosolibacter indicus]MBT1705311.1 HlyD family efflux transporter periplasmic adaptor subunit [Chryseosolibacter indicus]